MNQCVIAKISRESEIQVEKNSVIASEIKKIKIRKLILSRKIASAAYLKVKQ